MPLLTPSNTVRLQPEFPDRSAGEETAVLNFTLSDLESLFMCLHLIHCFRVN